MQQRITYYEREKIEFYLKCKQTVRHIARLLRRDHSVVSREIRRNKSDYFPYSAKVAQSATERKAKHTNTRKLDKNKQLYRYVASKLKEGWSPEQISGRLKNHPPNELKSRYISHEQIYDYIYNDGRDECFNRLYQYLRRANPRRQFRYARKRKNKANIPHRVSIHDRPETVETRQEYGHWESDTLCFGRRRQAVSVQYERKSQYLTLSKLTDHSAQETIDVIKGQIETMSPHFWRSVTFDNGKEAVRHIELKKDYDVSTYFCDGYKSWQKGGVENANGLLRQYLPKKALIDQITNEYIYQIQDKLNNRPRKKLDYMTPNEIIKKLQSGALNS